MTIHETISAAGVTPGGRMSRAALLLCGNHHLAEDLTQTTYGKVYAAWSRVSVADSPVACTRTVLLRT